MKVLSAPIQAPDPMELGATSGTNRNQLLALLIKLCQLVACRSTIRACPESKRPALPIFSVPAPIFLSGLGTEMIAGMGNFVQESIVEILLFLGELQTDTERPAAPGNVRPQAAQGMAALDWDLGNSFQQAVSRRARQALFDGSSHKIPEREFFCQ
jgi:hypothetical protein